MALCKKYDSNVLCWVESDRHFQKLQQDNFQLSAELLRSLLKLDIAALPKKELSSKAARFDRFSYIHTYERRYLHGGK